LVEILLEAGARLDAYNVNRDNPVLICCRTGQYRILEILLNKVGPEETKKYLETWAEIDGFVPLLASAELDKVECIKICIKFNADIETRTADTNQIIAGATALHLACYYGRQASVKTLIDLGANVISQTTVNGWTPLHIAIKQGHVDIVRYLLSQPNRKLMLEIIDNDNRIPSYYANIVGNESMKEEFFTNHLAQVLEHVINGNPEREEACCKILSKYHCSPGCFEASDITSLRFDKNSSLLAEAIIHSNIQLTNTLLTMGGSIHTPDDYGVTPEFWINYLKNTSNNVNLLSQLLYLNSCNTGQISSTTNIMLSRIEAISKKNFQNKMLLNINVGKSNMITNSLSDGQLNVLTKMTDGYGLDIKPQTLSNLKDSVSKDYLLLGFLDKIKSTKVIPEGKDFVESLVFDAKINLIKVMATKDTQLQPAHVLALYLYSSNYNVFSGINIGLINWAESNMWTNMIYCLYQAAKLLPPHQGEVYRGVKCDFDPSVLAIGNVLQWNTFSICSTEWKYASELINTKSGIIFIIKSQSGRDISYYSKHPVDNEVLFLPGTTFIVTNHYIASVICLGQANIRTSTFQAKEKDLIKAANKEACICVELEELTCSTISCV
jgi:ankyrin repeat protein